MYAPFQKVYNVGFRVIIEYDSEAELDAEFSSWDMASAKTTSTSETIQTPEISEEGNSLDATITATRITEGQEGLWMLIDGDHKTKWFDHRFEANMWIQIQLEGGVKEKCSSYRLVSGNDQPLRDPRGWELYGSNDEGTNWALLDKRSGEVFKKRQEAREFSIENSVPYNSYKFVITECSKGVQLSEIELNLD